MYLKLGFKVENRKVACFRREIWNDVQGYLSTQVHRCALWRAFMLNNNRPYFELIAFQVYPSGNLSLIHHKPVGIRRSCSSILFNLCLECREVTPQLCLQLLHIHRGGNFVHCTHVWHLQWSTHSNDIKITPLVLLNLCLNADLLWCVHRDKHPWASGLSDSIQALEGSIVSLQSTSLCAVMSVMSDSSVTM